MVEAASSASSQWFHDFSISDASDVGNDATWIKNGIYDRLSSYDSYDNTVQNAPGTGATRTACGWTRVAVSPDHRSCAMKIVAR
jgi:hypothetical protein